MPLVPLVPLIAPGDGVFDGTDVEVPVPPTMPASLPVPEPVAPVAFCAGIDDDGSASPLPEAPLPMPLDEAPLDEVPVDEPLVVLPGAGVFDGTEVEVPVPPTMPASLPVVAPVAPVAFCAGIELDGTVELCAIAKLAQATIAEPSSSFFSVAMMFSWNLLNRWRRATTSGGMRTFAGNGRSH